MKLRFHVVSLPNNPTSMEFCSCAYNSKVLKFAKMMTARGHTVFHYGIEGSDVQCEAHFNTLSKEEHNEFFSHDQTKTVSPIVWDAAEPYWEISNAKAAYWIKRNHKPRDYVLVIGGACQQPIQTKLAKCPVDVVEFGVGYYGTFAKYRVFESQAHRHNVHGRDSWRNGGLTDPDGQNYDAVIPNYFDLEDFTVNLAPQDYYLFMGRLINRKGLSEAINATRRAGVKLKICGQGGVIKDGGLEADGMRFTGDHFEYVGFADAKKRDELMGGAKAILCPTKYVGPFEGTAVESQMCGTPAITTDFGAFTETVLHGITGYRCHNISEMEWAIREAPKLDRALIAVRARATYSLERVGQQYEEYFERLHTLWEGGWDKVHPVASMEAETDVFLRSKLISA